MGEDLFSKLEKEVQDVIDAIIKAKEAGKLKSAGDIFRFLFGLVGELVDVAEAATGAGAGVEKKEFVMKAFTYAYTKINPDIPWIPDPVESYIENWVLDHGLPAFIDFLVARMNAARAAGAESVTDQ